MQYYFFGIPTPGNYILDEAKRIGYPGRCGGVGRTCDHCGENIEVGEAGYAVALHDEMPKLYAHNHCFLVAAGVIPVYPWHQEEWRTARQVAEAAVNEWLER